MRIGRMSHKVDFLFRADTQDSYGELKDDWTVFRKGIWASKEPLIGREYFSALSVDNKTEVKFNTRYIEGITSEMRIQHHDEVYEILGPPVDVQSRNRELLFYCRRARD